MAEMITLPVGRTDFREIRQAHCYYVDKTSSISKLIRDGAKSILFTRPRRFGKTTFQSMLRSFFDIREDSRDIFSGLAVMEDREAVENWMNRYPVVYLSFKDIDGLKLEYAIDVLRSMLVELFQGYGFLRDDDLGGDAGIFGRILLNKASIGDIRQSLNILAKLLYNHYGRKVIFIFDEYDVPLDKAERNGYYDEMLDVIRAMFLSVLKDCPYTEKGILTGCLRISKESLFTGLNNLAVYSVTGAEYADAFGFTEEEVLRLLSDTGLTDKADVIQKWYDGYAIGDRHIYTPWDVLSYVKRLQVSADAEPENYWANSSGNDVIRRLIDMTDAEVGVDYSALIDGRNIEKRVLETLTYGDLYSSEENIWSLLLATGYLTLAGKYYPNGETFLKLPNEEIRCLFAYYVDEWFSENIRKSSRKALFHAIWTGDTDMLSEQISQYLFDTISYYDYREDYYHAFLAGLLSGAGYIVKSNRESGTGRADILLLDRKNRRAAVFEVKRTSSADDMEKAAESALEQIRAMEYGDDLQGYREIIRYGIAFFRKDAVVMKAEAQDL